MGVWATDIVARRRRYSTWLVDADKFACRLEDGWQVDCTHAVNRAATAARGNASSEGLPILIRYGLIPEFLGRLPVVGVLGDLDKGALMQILTEPKNALIRQYQRLFEFENVRLRFADDALETVAELALQRKVGARGLRMILEDLMLELMYNLPAQRKLREFVVTAEMVRSREINWTLLEKAG